MTRDRGSLLDRALRIFGDVRPGEGAGVLLLFFNIWFLLVAYYILKTVREPLILMGGGAELKAYAAAAQAALLIVYVPAYAWVASRLPRRKLILSVVLFFFGCVQVFCLAVRAGLPYVGFAFFIWVGIFSLTMIAQFWSYANDLYQQAAGKRLFPLIAIGSTAGAPLGAALAAALFRAEVGVYAMMQLAAVLLLVHLGLYGWIGRRLSGSEREVCRGESLERGGGFRLVFRSRYLLLMAAVIVVLNTVNTTGEFMLSEMVVNEAEARAAASSGFDTEAFIGGFYGTFFFGVNLATILIQAFLVSRMVKYLGMAGMLFALPIVAFGSYSLIALGASFVVLRWAKTAENSTDYSVMNTAQQMLWLPTSREEKYKAKQAIDTFFKRLGDLFSAGIVFVGTHWLALEVKGFGLVNVVLVLLWGALALALYREYREVAARHEAETGSSGGDAPTT
jgi:AAA family ATP:ADP antiporter